MRETLLLHSDSETGPDLRYATGFVVPDPVFWFRRKGKSHLLVNPLELGRARAQARVDVVVDQNAERDRLAKRIGRVPKPLEVLVAILRRQRVTSVTVPERFPVATADFLRKNRIRVVVRDGLFFPERAVKRPDEVAAIRKAQAATEAGVAKAVAALKASRPRGGFLSHGGERVTSEYLRWIVEAEMLRHGALGQHTIVASGDQCVDPHDVGSGPVRPNTTIIFDVFPRDMATGYYADMSRTVVRGKASKQVRALYDSVLAGQQYAFDRIRAGAKGREIHDGIRKLFEERGHRTGPRDGKMEGFFHGTGHSLGLEIHEPPGIGARDETLPAGAVVTVEPGLYYPGVGGVRLEDMVLVKKDGCENLTGFEKVLEI
jgi:Xaa-Pro aminopeptidase